MPYSRNAQYYHYRLRDKRSFARFITASPLATDYHGKWRHKDGVKAILGLNRFTGKWEVQGLRIPKDKYDYKQVYG